MTVVVQVNQADLMMEVNMRASVSLISEATYKQLWKGHLLIYPNLNKIKSGLRTYSGELLSVLGSIDVNVV